MSSNKAALKAAKSALDGGNYDETISQAQVVLKSDAENYNARLLLGRAYEKSGKPEDAINTYRAATKSKPDDVQAWLGLCSVLQTQGEKSVDDYIDAAVHVAELHAAAEDAHRCQTVIDKLTSFVRLHGNTAQQKRLLHITLPGNTIYDFLEGRLPHPSHTYVRLAELTEDDEARRISSEINVRRTRLGAKIGQVTTEVKREVLAQSDLEDFYRNVINWSNDDDIRREYEEKLLQRVYDALLVVPVEERPAKRDQALDLAEGMVIIHHPFLLAWDLVLETRDLENLRDLDVNILREYCILFTESGLARVLDAWLTSELSPFPAPRPSEDDKETPAEPMSAEDRLMAMTEGLAKAEESPFAHRLVSDYFLHLEEHQSTVETARAGLQALDIEAEKLSMTLQNTKDALNAALGTALVHYQSPRNHAEARRRFEDILSRKSQLTSALIGLGLIFEERGYYEDAIRSLQGALTQDPNNVQVGVELAWCKALDGDYDSAKEELEIYLPKLKPSDPRARDLRAQCLYRIGICMWELDTSKTARKDRQGAYAYFLSAIKTNVNFAPAYTSLGYYYEAYARDKKRARQCFQKAFELSPNETDAAERLARSFADQGDWDIVQVISQRVIDSGRARPPPGSKRKGLSWPYSALGVVQMNRQDYQQAIVSFLAALRISPDDYQSYVGLGESYHNSGRYNSASRTFNYALSPHDGQELRVTGESWFARYMLANVHRELGEFDEAIEGLQAVLEERPSEFGVLLSLLQTFVERAWHCVETGLFGQAVRSCTQAIETATKVAEIRPDAFNMWKAVGDACSTMSWVQSGSDDLMGTGVSTLLSGVTTDSSVPDVIEDGVRLNSITDTATNGQSAHNAPSKPILAGILAYKQAIRACTNDSHAQAVAWYNSGWAEHRASVISDAKSSMRYTKAAVRCFKRAIELEAGNAEFWNALGVVTTTLNPQVAQHSFVRSLHLNELNARVWTNLGLLYLLRNDFDLAHKAFGRAQSTDPDYAHAWVGEGLLALMSGDLAGALNMFTHASEISDSASLIIKRQYALASFDQLAAPGHVPDNITTLIRPLFALDQLHSQAPGDLPYRHLVALFLERVGNYADAVSVLTELCDAAEADYEATESDAALARYALAKADIARCQLAVQDFTAASESAQTALDLTSDPANSGLDVEGRHKLRLSAHLTAGLAQHHLGQGAESVTMFRDALVESDSDPDVVSVLVQVLWARGGEREKTAAREQLLESIEKHSEHAGSITLLATIATLENDDETAAAAQDDLVVLRTSDKLNQSDIRRIETLLSTLSALGADSDGAAQAAAQSAIALNPEHTHAWTELAEVTGGTHAAEIALSTAQKAISQGGGHDAGAFAKAFAGVGSAGDAQRAIALAPWERTGWETLADALS
ncbi:hypothetical protein B0A48_12570 [Cryoendolithus antarcticus]|uniref:Superkiller protein 3 n=1 Tax=Cryoendolithus antarcticus TaxID=1507870 RepID=A0A1V8SQS7_9PEZI|nr:hypothetical protein B0A48_12570 [Cryoendolithus antarcticus]